MKKYGVGGAIRRRTAQMRNNPANPTSRREKEKDGGYKRKTGGILGQNKEKTRVANAFGGGESGVTKTKRRFGRTVEVTRTASGKAKTVTKKDGTVTKDKKRGSAKKPIRSMEKGGKVKAVKNYNRGGRVVAQGADRDDVRADRKAARQENKKDRKQARAKRRGDRRLKRDIKRGRVKPVTGMAAGAASAVGSNVAKASKNARRKNA